MSDYEEIRPRTKNIRRTPCEQQKVCLPTEHRFSEGYTRVLSGPAHPFHSHFNPAPSVRLGYDDLKIIQA